MNKNFKYNIASSLTEQPLANPTEDYHAANKKYVDTHTADILADANAYTDTQVAGVLADANDYTDTQVAGILNTPNVVNIGTLTGGTGWSVANYTISFLKVGKFITMYLPDTSDTASTSSVVSSGAGVIPAGYRPANICVAPIFVHDNNLGSIGVIKFSTTGSFEVGKVPSNEFATPGNFGANECGWHKTHISYITA